ncbi:type I restriction enzyme, S subunit [Vibrio crassostreae]|nr:type I restriction enzyme, S subunit [Vibrio crassostreae]CAK3724315.1 type I restriction enzyme, S subunit [Vibrio crassostreae]CAK3727634.1 type I restriction enzyme, S subunit [Vibrio crassostreae]
MNKQVIKLKDICREPKLTSSEPLKDGYDKYIGLEHIDSNSLTLSRWGSVAQDKPSFTRVFKKGHILLGKRRPYLRKAAIASFDGICSGDIIVLEANESVVDPELFPFLIHSNTVWSHAIKTSSGSLSPRTKFKDLGQVEFSLPDLAGQKMLANDLLNIQRNRISVEQQIEATSQLISSLLQKTCGSLGKYNPTDNLDDRCSKGSVVVRLKDILVKVSRPVKLSDDTEYGTVVARRAFGGVEAREVILGKNIKVKSQFEIREGDFLISKRQIVHGGCGVVPKSLTGSVVSNEYDVFNAKDGLDMSFFAWLVKTPRLRNYFFINSVGIHIEKMLFKTEHWLNMPIILPPIAIQRTIAKSLNELDSFRRLQFRKIDHLEEIKTHLLSE